MFIFYRTCCISHDYAPMIYCIYYCRVRMEKYCMDFYALRRIIYANLDSLSLFYKATGNQGHLVQETTMSRIRKEKL